MSSKYNCPRCGHQIEYTAAEVGQSVPCHGCEHLLTLPGTAHSFSQLSADDAPPARGVSTSMVIGFLGAASVFMCLCGGLWVMFVYPAVESARRNRCISNGKCLSLAFHNFHDVHRTLPLASSEPVSGIPGKADLPHVAGYSWIVALLPYIEEQPLSNEIEEQSQDLWFPPFDSQLTQHASQDFVGCVEMAILRCPSSGAAERVDVSASDYQLYPYQSGRHSPASSSYLSLPASHRLNLQGLAELPDSNPDDDTVGNGVLVFPRERRQNLHWGIKFSDVTDGTSKTIIFCETRETAYAAWIDGQATWAVGAWPQNTAIPDARLTTERYMGWPPSDVQSVTSLKAAQDDTNIYLKATQFGGSYDRQAGPSSDHSGGVVIHAFADGHVNSISPDIDRNLYLRMISRNGGEPINTDTY